MIEANTFRGSSARLMDLTQRKNIALESLVLDLQGYTWFAA